MGIYRSTNPTDWNAVDGIIIAESAPPPNIAGSPANIAIMVGQFERGPTDLEEPGSIGALYELYGNNDTFKGNLALKNKRFGRLRIVRAVASNAVAATKTFQSAGAVDIIKFDALYKGAYGNNIKVTIAAGSSSGSKYTIHDANPNAVLPDEVYDNVVITAIATSAPFANSKLIKATVIATTDEPATAAATALASGSDGAIADTDYQSAISPTTEVEAAGNILFLDEYNSTRNGYLKQSMATTQDKMCIVCGSDGDTVSAAQTDVALNRDSDGRIIYAYPWVITNINGVNTHAQPAAFYASLLSQIAPNIDPAYAANTQYLPGIVDLVSHPTRADYINLVNNGVSAFEIDTDIGPKVKSGVVTQIADTSKVMVFRRRMADYLTASIAKFLKAYQNAPNTKDNRTAVKAAILAFIQRSEQDGLLPKDSDVKSGVAKLVDTESLNTDSTIAQGYFKILYKQRIFSSMRFIVLIAQIGESVVVTEADAK